MKFVAILTLFLISTYPKEVSTSTWNEGYKQCSGARGGLVTLHPGERLENLRGILSGKSPVWLGGRIAHTSWRWTDSKQLYQYSGCFAVPVKMTLGYSGIAEAFDCFRKCNSKYIYAAISGDKCACIDYIGNLSVSNNSKCNNGCPRNFQETCGGHGYVSIYKRSETDFPWTDNIANSDDSDCGFIRYEPPRAPSVQNAKCGVNDYRWKPSFCQSKDDTRVFKDPTYQRWDGACNGYIKAHVTTKDNLGFDAAPNSPQLYWIGLKRTTTWQWVDGRSAQNDYSNIDSQDKQYGGNCLAVRQDENRKIHLITQECQFDAIVRCADGTSPTSTSTILPSTSTKSTITTDSTTTATTSTSTTTSTTTTTSTPTTTVSATTSPSSSAPTVTVSTIMTSETSSPTQRPTSTTNPTLTTTKIYRSPDTSSSSTSPTTSKMNVMTNTPTNTPHTDSSRRSSVRETTSSSLGPTTISTSEATTVIDIHRTNIPSTRITTVASGHETLKEAGSTTTTPVVTLATSNTYEKTTRDNSSGGSGTSQTSVVAHTDKLTTDDGITQLGNNVTPPNDNSSRGNNQGLSIGLGVVGGVLLLVILLLVIVIVSRNYRSGQSKIYRVDSRTRRSLSQSSAGSTSKENLVDKDHDSVWGKTAKRVKLQSVKDAPDDRQVIWRDENWGFEMKDEDDSVFTETSPTGQNGHLVGVGMTTRASFAGPDPIKSVHFEDEVQTNTNGRPSSGN